MLRADQDASRPIYCGKSIIIGQFRRGPKHRKFGGPHQTSGTLIVFPRTSVTITHAGGKPVIADPNTVMFYNEGQEYFRTQLSVDGDLCESFGIDRRLVADAIRPFNAHIDDHPHLPFEFSHGPGDPISYLLQRLVVNHVLSDQHPNPLYIEETVLHVLKRVAANSYLQRGITAHKTNHAREKELVDAVRKLLATHFDQNLSLEQIALHLNYSAFHLCRLFQKHTGLTIHKYLKRLRLQTSLEYVTQANTDLTTLALKLGFSSHSHFTEAFRKTFGTPPSTLRNTSREFVHELYSKISIA